MKEKNISQRNECAKIYELLEKKILELSAEENKQVSKVAYTPETEIISVYRQNTF